MAVEGSLDGDETQGEIIPVELTRFVLDRLISSDEAITIVVNYAKRASMVLPPDPLAPIEQEQIDEANEIIIDCIDQGLGWLATKESGGTSVREYPQALEAFRVMLIRLRRTAELEPACFRSFLLCIAGSGQVLIW